MDPAKYIGIPFVPLGRDKNEGLDCYGLMRELAKDNGHPLPDYEYEGNTDNVFALNFHKSVFEIDEADRQAGDVVVLEYPVQGGIHIGMLINRNEFIHTTRKTGVVIGRLSDQVVARRIKGFYRIKENADG